MKIMKGMEQSEVIERGVNALYKELGPAGTKRFIALTHPVKREESVARHRKWQARLKKEDFFKEMREAYKKIGKK
jgi:hypothetical protein